MDAAHPRETIQALLHEDRTFPPDPAFTQQANVNDPGIYEKAAADPVAFWEGFAKELHWTKPWETALEWNRPDAKWFVGGKLNAAANCLDRHLNGPRKNKAAIIWEGEPGDERVLT